jgi:hypothetical protein
MFSHHRRTEEKMHVLWAAKSWVATTGCHEAIDLAADPVFGSTRIQRRRPNSRSPVSLSKWSGHDHTRHERSPRGENQRPVQLGCTVQCVA